MKTNKRGFTLIEIMVSLIIVSIVCLIATTMMFSVFNNFKSTTKMNEDKLYVDKMFELVSKKLQFARNVQILEENSSETPKYDNVFKVENNKLIFNNEDIYGDLLDSNTGVDITVKASDNTINMTIILKDKSNSDVYRDSMTFKINTIESRQQYIEGTKNQEVENPIISYEDSPNYQYDLKTIPNTLYEQLSEMPRFYDTLTREEKIRIKKEIGYLPNTTNEWWKSNDAFRLYLLKKVYNGVWPTFPKDSEGKLPPLPYTTEPWYIQPYIYLNDGAGSEGYLDVTVYINTTSGNGNWTSVYMIYDYSEQQWYYTDKLRNNIGVMNRPWSAIKSDIKAKGWKVYNIK